MLPRRQSKAARDILAQGHGEIFEDMGDCDVRVREVAAAEREDAAETARAERAFVAVLAAVIALKGYALAWFLG